MYTYFSKKRKILFGFQNLNYFTYRTTHSHLLILPQRRHLLLPLRHLDFDDDDDSSDDYAVTFALGVLQNTVLDEYDDGVGSEADGSTAGVVVVGVEGVMEKFAE